MIPAEIAVLFCWSFAVSFAGGTVGLVLGNLRLPVVVLIGSSAAAAAGANVAISGAAALTAALVHWRHGRVDLRLFLWMAPSSLAGAIAGGLLTGVLSERFLLGAISIVVLYGAVEIWRMRRPGQVDTGPEPQRSRLMVEAVLIGFGVGLLGGIVGLILGSLRLPAMLKYMGVRPAGAVGTNSAVGVAVGVGGLIGHLPGGIDWTILVVGAAASIPAAWLGARFTGRVSEDRLLKWFTVILVISGLALAAQAVAA